MDIQIYVREENVKIPVSVEKLKKASFLTFQLTGKESGDISLVICDDQFISELNIRYNKRKGSTDVLSFSMREGEFPLINNTILGDIVISVDTAKRQAETRGETLEEEFLILFIHGLLHLLGYDHVNPQEKKRMNEYTKKIFMELK